MARKGSAARRVVEDIGTGEPSRPDNIPPQTGDDTGGVVDINTGKSEEETIDVNAIGRDDDARSDAEKAAERQRAEDERERLANANARTDEPELRTDDDDDRPRSRVRQRRENRERELARRSTEQVTNLTAQNRQLQERLAKLERSGSEREIEGSIATMKAQIETLKKELEAAIEAGETSKQLDLTIKIGEVQGRLALAERDLQNAKAAPAVKETTAEAGADPMQGKRPAIVDDWIKANRKWWNLPSAKLLRDAAVAIDKQIREEIADGELDFDEYTEEHVDELTERLAEERERLGEQFAVFEIRDFEGEEFVLDEPDQNERDRGDRETAANGRDREKSVRGNDRGTRRSPQGGMGGREGRRGAMSDLELARQGKARLTEDDYAQMRVFKLDPNDPNVRKRFARERVRTILTEAQKGAK